MIDSSQDGLPLSENSYTRTPSNSLSPLRLGNE